MGGACPGRAASEFAPYQRSEYASHFEEIALLTNSGLVRKEVAFFIYGYMAIRIWDDEEFWQGLNRDVFWLNLERFVADMKRLRDRPIAEIPKVKF